MATLEVERRDSVSIYEFSLADENRQRVGYRVGRMKLEHARDGSWRPHRPGWAPQVEGVTEVKEVIAAWAAGGMGRGGLAFDPDEGDMLTWVGTVSEGRYDPGTFKGMSIEQWGRFLHEREGITAVRINGSAIWTAQRDELADALEAVQAALAED